MKGFNHTLFIIATIAVLSSAGLMTFSHQPVSGETLAASPQAAASIKSSPLPTTSPRPMASAAETDPTAALPPQDEAAATIIPESTPKRDTPTPVAPAPVPAIASVLEKPSVPTTEPSGAPTSLTELVNQLTNDARAKRGLPPLGYNAELANVAKERSQDMVNRNYFSHTSLDGCDVTCRFKQTSLNTLSWGENIARYEGLSLSSTEEAVRTLFADWLQSRGHRENILSETFTHQGVGIAIKGDQLIITVVFASPQ